MHVYSTVIAEEVGKYSRMFQLLFIALGKMVHEIDTLQVILNTKNGHLRNIWDLC